MINLNMNPEQFREKFFELIKDARNILITSHTNPDDDSISTVLSLYYFLKEKFADKNIRIIYSGDFNRRWEYFENFDKIESVNDVSEVIGEFDSVICVDGGQFSRFSNLPESFINFKGTKICIDHHSSPPDQFDLIYIDSSMTSAAEVLFTIFIDPKEVLPKRFAECLILGILGDTGTFQFIKPSQTKVFKTIEKLMNDGGVDIQDLKSKYSTYSEKAFKLLREFIKNFEIIEVNGWPKFLYSYIDRDFVEANGYSYLEVSEAAHIAHSYTRSIKGVGWGFILYPTENGNVKITLRSLPDSVNVRIMMEEFGIGGGHDRASGGSFKSENGESIKPQDCFSKLIEWMEKNKPTLS